MNFFFFLQEMGMFVECRKEAFLTEKYTVFCFVLKEKLKMHK